VEQVLTRRLLSPFELIFAAGGPQDQQAFDESDALAMERTETTSSDGPRYRRDWCDD
jgi:hypothetical protein